MKKYNTEFDEAVEAAVDVICEKAEKCREGQSITSDIDLMYLRDDMVGYLKQVEMLQDTKTVKELRVAMSYIFNAKDVKKYMKGLK